MANPPSPPRPAAASGLTRRHSTCAPTLHRVRQCSSHTRCQRGVLRHARCYARVAVPSAAAAVETLVLRLDSLGTELSWSALAVGETVILLTLSLHYY